MQNVKMIKQVVLHNLPISKIELKVLKTLVNIRIANAYALWKMSDLKHYPTVLRALKKLEDKGCTEISSEGIRGEKRYIPTIRGILTLLTLEEDQEALIKIISENSPKFRELVKDNINIDNLVSDVIQRVCVWKKPEKKHNIDEIIEEEMTDYIYEGLLGLDEEDKDEIVKLTRSDWIKRITIKESEEIINWHQNQVKTLKEFKTILKNN